MAGSSRGNSELRGLDRKEGRAPHGGGDLGDAGEADDKEGEAGDEDGEDLGEAGGLTRGHWTDGIG